MPTATPSRRTRTTRKLWVLAYQDALGTEDDPVLEATFKTEEEAVRWANTEPVVSLWLEEHEQLLGEGGRLIGTAIERHEI